MLNDTAFFKPPFQPSSSDKPDLMQVLVLQDIAHVFYTMPAIDMKSAQRD